MAEYKPKHIESPDDINKNTLHVFKSVSNDPDGYHLMHHYLYFEESANAHKAAEVLKNKGYSVDVSESPGDLTGNLKWLTLAGKISLINDRTMDDERRTMEDIARAHEGEYDGWEVQIQDGDASDFISQKIYD